jgi:hypothetical protein
MSALHPRTVAWAALWFLVVVTFTAGVGVISAASAAGEMPPLTTGVQTVLGELPDGPSSAPVADSLQAG